MVRKLAFILCLCLALCSACRHHNDQVLAQVYQYKLYASEVTAGMPVGLSADDSLALVRDYIDSWVKEKLILHEAEQKLSPREKNFNKELSDYRNSLLIHKYYEKLWSKDTSFNRVTENEITEFAHSLDDRYTVEKEIVRVNYVKLPSRWSQLPTVKEILFDEDRRQDEKEKLVKLLGDSIEYLIDDDAWLYLDDLQNEISFQIDPQQLPSKNVVTHIEKEVGDNVVFLVILDYRAQRSVNETKEERAAAGMLLLNQRKAQFINQYVQELYDKAVKAGAVVQ